MSEAEPTSGAARADGTFVALRIAVGVTVGVIWAGDMLALVARASVTPGDPHDLERVIARVRAGFSGTV